MDTNKRKDSSKSSDSDVESKKGYQSQSEQSGQSSQSGSSPSSGSASESSGTDKADFDTSDQVSGASKEEGLGDLEHGSSKSNDDVRSGTSDVKSRGSESEEEESELSGREGSFGEGIPPKPEGDQGYGRHSGQSGAI